ncbi:helix-turn-helix domain-containing protein [Kitasatospora sp. NBC_01266]|uniref:helix-turn-helix domain-containing protein n=1 Tax=Kitasatospora sp. NBC_01266 TaxID=2903572 RepID=UPI002E3517CB|nr:helix-turn-helix transcriptional regulator [Kitasatospora sp. NBC_01266]
MTQDWARLGSALRADRQAAGDTQDSVAEALGVHRNTVTAIEAGSSRRITSTIRAYARELGWDDGSVEAVLAGGEPCRTGVVEAVPAPSSAAEDLAQRLAAVLVARLPQRALQELSDGHVVDFDVVDLREDGSAAILNLVVERGADLPPAEQIRDDLREWTHVQRGMRRVVQERQQTQAIDQVSD